MSVCKCTGNCKKNKECLRYIPEDYGQTRSSLEDICIKNNYSEFIPYREYVLEEKLEKFSYSLDDFIMNEIKKTMGKTN